MIISTLWRKCKILFKRLLDPLRPYPAILRYCPKPARVAQAMGAIFAKDALVDGPLSLWEPAWVQVNAGAKIRGLSVDGPWCFYAGENTHLAGFKARTHTAVLADKILEARPLSSLPRLTVDFEGCSHARNRQTLQGEAVQRAACKCALQLHARLRECRLPSTWYMVGQLFRDPLMDRAISALMADPLVEIGWHSYSHINYFFSSRAEAAGDLEKLQALREASGLRLDCFCFPYNAVGWLDLCIEAGIREFRGYIGQYYLPVHMDFGYFSFRGTSMFLGPKTVNACLAKLPAPPGFTFFCHDVDWVGQDMRPLFSFIDQFRASLDIMES